MADPRLEVIAVPERGTFSWPGRDALHERTRILLESRTLKALAYATGNLSAENLESVLGFWAYLQADWRWLRETHWKGGIPHTDSATDYLDLLRN